jgi:hypothetical protein
MSSAVPESDWRLRDQEEYLLHITLARKCYVPPRPDWDHDHCVFCFAKFMATPGPDILTEGYCTAAAADWICPQCFADFQERFGWTVHSSVE